jgi:uncharacterized protein
MALITRRGLLKGIGIPAASAGLISGYGLAGEPMVSPRVTRYWLTPPNWPKDLKLSIAAVADVHACEPYMSAERIQEICLQTNALRADLIVLLGDYMTGHHFISAKVPEQDWAKAMGQLRAPLGVHAILGNHDYWQDHDAQKIRKGPTAARRALEQAGIPVYENDVVRLAKDGLPFWLAGLADQMAFLDVQRSGHKFWTGVDDLDGTLAKIKDEAPVILLAHEPDIFPKVPDRVALTLSGHTHGGQIRILGYAPFVPSSYGNRFAYGHIVENGNNLIVSGGLGCSSMPVRIGSPPEIVHIEIGGTV